MKIVPFLLVVFSAISSLCQAQSGVYKHVDKDGQVIYSDTGAKGASELHLPEITVVPAARHSPASDSSENAATLRERKETLDNKNNHEIKQTQLDSAADDNSVQTNASQISDADRIELIIEDMALYENDIEALEMELYNLGSGY